MKVTSSAENCLAYIQHARENLHKFPSTEIEEERLYVVDNKTVVAAFVQGVVENGVVSYHDSTLSLWTDGRPAGYSEVISGEVDQSIAEKWACQSKGKSDFYITTDWNIMSHHFLVELITATKKYSLNYTLPLEVDDIGPDVIEKIVCESVDHLIHDVEDISSLIGAGNVAFSIILDCIEKEIKNEESPPLSQ